MLSHVIKNDAYKAFLMAVENRLSYMKKHSLLRHSLDFSH